MLARLLSLTRYTIAIPVLGAWIAALLALALGAYEIILSILMVPTGIEEKSVKLLVLNLIEGVDLFLLGTAFYIISLGLYELFLDENAPLPGWLVIHNLDDLKNKLLSVVIVVLAVQFLAQVLGWKGGVDILNLGAAIAVVIFALAFFIVQQKKTGSKPSGNPVVVSPTGEEKNLQGEPTDAQ